MDEVLLSDLLAAPKYFAPANASHRVVEFRGDEHARETAVVEDFPATEKSFATLWRRRSDDSGRPVPAGAQHQQPLVLRVLMCQPRILDQDIWPLPMSPDGLTTLLAELGIPSIFPRAICHHMPLAAPFACPDRPGRFGVMLRTNLSHTWQYAAAVVHDATTRHTDAVVLGLKGPEADEVLESLRRAPLRDLACPAALPCLLVDKGLDAVVRDVEARRRNLTQICQQLSSDGFHHADIADDQLQWERDVVDLDRAMKILTGMSDVCAGIDAVCLMQRDFLAVLGGPGGGGGLLRLWDPDDKDPRARRAALMLDTFGHVLKGIESKIVYSKTSVQGQIQTIYALISQRESRSQVELARISRRLAELTQHESTHMRVIAGVTLVFLPATFTATFFSTTFFDFRPEFGDGGDGGGRGDYVSRWIWLYFVLTAGLTGAVLGLWWYAARSVRQRTQLQLRRRSELKEKAFREDTFPSSPAGMSLVSSRVNGQRPYLSGSEAEVFQKRVTLPTTPASRTDSGGQVSPLAGRKSSIWWGRDRTDQIEEE